MSDCQTCAGRNGAGVSPHPCQDCEIERLRAVVTRLKRERDEALAQVERMRAHLDVARATVTPSAMGCECAHYAYAPGEMGLPDRSGHHPACSQHDVERLTRERDEALAQVERLRAALSGILDVVDHETACHPCLAALHPGDLPDADEDPTP